MAALARMLLGVRYPELATGDPLVANREAQDNKIRMGLR